MNTHPADAAIRAAAPEFRLADLEFPDCPVFLSVAVPAAPEVTGAKPRLPSGRGLSRQQARLSAAGEAVELVASLARAGSGSGRDVVEVPAAAGGAPLQVAAAEIWLDHAIVHGGTPAAEATSAGCAARFDGDEAALAALLELIERDAMSAWWHGGHARGQADADLIAAAEPRFADWLASRERRTTLIDISTDIPAAAYAAVSHDATGRRVAIGSAAALNAGAAALSALTEMVQTEAAMDLASGTPPADLADWLDTPNIMAMAQFRNGGLEPARAMARDYADLAQAMAALGLPAYRFDFDNARAPFKAVRMVAPGLTRMGAPERARIAALRAKFGWTYPPERELLFETREPF